MTRVLFATRAWESPEIEGGYLLLKDLAIEFAQESNGEWQPTFLSISGGREHGVYLKKSLSDVGWGSQQRRQVLFALILGLRQVDVVHLAHTPTAGNALLMRLLKRLYPRVHFVQTITGYRRSPKWPRSLLWGDTVTTISSFTASELFADSAQETVTITPWPRPARIDNAPGLPEALATTLADCRVALFPLDVFRLDLSRFDVASLAKRLITQHADLHLIFLDRFGGEETIRSALDPETAVHVSFLPVIDYMPALLKRSSVAVFPMTDVEGKFNPPMVLLEALHYGAGIACSANIDLPLSERVFPVNGFQLDRWLAAVGLALEHDGPAPVNRFDENVEKYLEALRPVPTPSRPGPPVSFSELLETLNDRAVATGQTLYRRRGSIDGVDLTGRGDFDLWVDRTAALGVHRHLLELGATLIIQRRARNWISHNVYLLFLTDGVLQLDLGIGRIGAGFVHYCHVDELDTAPGICELPADVELFSLTGKKLIRGKSASSTSRNADIPRSLDDAAQKRMNAFLGATWMALKDALDANVSTTELSRICRPAIFKNALQVLRHPLELTRVLFSKLAPPGRTKPFGRPIHGAIIVIVGTDGSGKSTINERLRERIGTLSYRIRSFYMGRARGNLLISERARQHGGKIYQSASTLRRLLKYGASWVYVLDYLVRFTRIWFLSRLLGVTVVCDRYHYDLKLMESYSRVGYRVLHAFSPTPDVLVGLDCDVATLMERKAERSAAEYARQRRFYRDLVAATRCRSSKLVVRTDQQNADETSEIIVRQILRATHRRLDY